MGKKRYLVTIDEDVYRAIRIEAVTTGETVGELIASKWRTPMEQVAKKAIEPDKAKAQGGKLTKGLGDVPGISEGTGRDVQQFRPVPKPSQKR